MHFAVPGTGRVGRSIAGGAVPAGHDGIITGTRAMETYLHFSLRLWNAVGHGRCNIGVVT